MNLYDNKLYKEDISYVTGIELPWDLLCGKKILISGASGLIGSFLIDALMMKNDSGLDLNVYALGRNSERAGKRFEKYWNDDRFTFISHDINVPLSFDIDRMDYVVHLASNTHPIAYANDPIGTITTNVIGTDNMLTFAFKHQAARFVFASSNEIYGENRGDVEFFDEKYCGYIDSNTMRAGYPESKRAGEALCQAYIKQKNMNVVIPRLTRSFGPSLLLTDTKALSQFISNAVNGEDIILKSDGTQYYSYTYVADAVSGLLTVLLKGKCGEAYNIADTSCDIQLKDLAQILADISGRKVVFDIPDKTEAAGYSKATKARLDGKKIKCELGWKCHYDMRYALERTVDVLKNIK